MTTDTYQLRALIAKWRSESTSDDQSSDYECGEHSARSECADELEATLAQQAGAEPVAYVDLANWHGGLRADECFFTDWQDDDTVPLYLAQQPAAQSGAAASAEPAVWVAADTLNSPHPTCISSLAYMSQLDRERGREYVPLYAAPQQPVGVDEDAAIRAFEEHFQASSDDPYFEGELELWLTSWRKAITAQQQGGAE